MYLGHKTAAVFSDISRLNCNKTLSLTSTTDVLLNGEDEQEETRISLVHLHEDSPGVVFHWGVTKT